MAVVVWWLLIVANGLGERRSYEVHSAGVEAVVRRTGDALQPGAGTHELEAGPPAKKRRRLARAPLTRSAVTGLHTLEEAGPATDPRTVDDEAELEWTTNFRAWPSPYRTDRAPIPRGDGFAFFTPDFDDPAKSADGAETRAGRAEELMTQTPASAAEGPVGALPELEIASVAAKKNAGVAFAGGGGRAHVLALGYLRALRQRGLLSGIRYSAAVSGGAWGTAAFTYFQGDDEERYFGTIEPPERLTKDKVSAVPSGHVLEPLQFQSVMGSHWAVPQFVRGMVANLVHRARLAYRGTDVWRHMVWENYVKQTGIPSEDAVMAYDAQHAADLRHRNPWLESTPIVTPFSPDVPFMIVGVTICAPQKVAPLDLFTARPYSMLEVTPLYAGAMHAFDAEFTAGGLMATVRPLMPRTKHRLAIGGLVETPGFGMRVDAVSVRGGRVEQVYGVSAEGATHNDEGGPVQTASSGRPLGHHSLLDSLTITSWVLGGVLAELLPDFRITEWLGLTLGHWAWRDAGEQAPAGAAEWTGPVQAEHTLLSMGDGAVVQNVPLINLLQRKVACIVAFFSNDMVSTDVDFGAADLQLRTDQVDADFAAFFGINTISKWNYLFPLSMRAPASIGTTVRGNQVFAAADFPAVASALQDRMRQGLPAMATRRLATVANPWWGIPAGLEVTVTFSGLSKQERFFARLPEETRDFAAQQSWWRGFPEVGTLTATLHNLDAAEAHLLYQLAGNSVLDSADLLEAGLAHCPDHAAFP